MILVCSFISSTLGLLAPYLQKEFVDRLTGQHLPFEVHWLFSATSNWTPIYFIVVAFVTLLLSQAFLQLTMYLGAKEAIVSQKNLALHLYEKTLSLKVDTLSQRPIGEIVSFYATDVPGSTILLEQTLPQGATTFFPLLLAPVALSLLLDTSMVPTIILMLAVSSLNTYLALRQSRFFLLFKQLAAVRIGFVNEWIINLRGLRVLGWIEAFENKIQKVRITETENRVRMVTNGQVMNSIASSLTFALNVITLATLTLWSSKIPTSGEILASLWILGVFLTKPFRQMPWFFTFAFDGLTSAQRLQKFFNTENLTSLEGDPTTPITNPKESFLEVQGLHLQWPGHEPVLKNINFSAKKGEFVAIVGEVGAGKSLFLLSLLRETAAQYQKYKIDSQDMLKSPLETLHNYYSYVPQESFVMSASLGQNVVFDYHLSESEENKILQSLTVSQMRFDTERLPQKLATELGERGVNLSGGQKQRMSLARATYFNRQIILIDDGLSQLDVTTEKALLDDLFLGHWKQTTRILVTHRLSVLPFVDRILFLKKGEIIAEGTLTALMQRRDFQEFASSLTVAVSNPNIPIVDPEVTHVED